MTSEQKSYLISQLSLLLDQMVDAPKEQKAVKFLRPDDLFAWI